MSQRSRLSREHYGEIDGQAVELFTLAPSDAFKVQIINLGGTVTAVWAPDRNGALANVVLGFSTLAEYADRAKNPFFGCITGRFANRINQGRFSLDGVDYQIPIQGGPHALHGGINGFNRFVWAAETAESADGLSLILSHTSPHGDEGFPGELRTTVTYTVSAPGKVRIDYVATTDRPTVVNLTNHTYFNLAGEGSGSVLDHELQMHARRFTPVGASLIPTGEIAPVAGTPLDFTTPMTIGSRIRVPHEQLVYGCGYDHNFVIDRPDGDASLAPVADVFDPGSGRKLQVLTTEPGVQFYTGNFLTGAISGPSGRSYRQSDGFALETQHYPDSPNQPSFPSTVLRPGETFRSTTVWRFSA